MAVSIIIKTLNESKRIAAAIESALAALPDGRGEVIVADSGSTDRTVDIAATHPVRIAQIEAPAQASCGIGPQLGYQYAREDFICLIDGDMLLAPDFIAAAIAELDAHPELAGVTGHVVEMAVVNLEFSNREARQSPEKRTGPIDRMNGGGVYRRAALADVGYFSDRNLHSFEEFDLGVRLRARGWGLLRLDRRFVSHYGHTINSYRLLLRRWQTGYLFGTGEVLRAALGQPYLPQLLRELGELKLWAVVYLWWLTMLVLLLVLPDKLMAAGLDLLMIAGVVGIMAWRRRHLAMGLYSVVAWCFHAAALPVGFFRPRRTPSAWIESRLLVDKVPAPPSPSRLDA